MCDSQQKIVQTFDARLPSMNQMLPQLTLLNSYYMDLIQARI